MDAPVRTAFLRLAGLFAMVFGGLMLATVLVWRHAGQQDQLIAEQRFTTEVDELVAVLAQRMQSYETVLRSAAALYAASEKVTRSEWREFTAGLRLDLSHPGLQGIGYTPQVHSGELARHIAQAQAEGLPQYAVRPIAENVGHAYFPIFYLEPVDWRNLRAFGFDMASEARRHNAMMRARDEARPIMSAPIILVQETDQDVQPGVAMFWPLYRQSKGNESRAELLHGFVYSPFRMFDLIDGALPDRLKQLQLTLIDLDAGSESPTLYHRAAADHQPRFHAARELSVSGRRWQLQLSSTALFESELPNASAHTLLFGGTVLALLLALLMVSYARQRERLHQQQLRLTAQLQQREERFRMLLDGAPNAMLMVNAEGRIEWVNPQAEQLFGYGREELLSQPVEMLLPERYREQHSGWRRAFQTAPSPRQMGSGRELFARRKDGSEVQVEIGLSPIHTDEGLKTVGSIIDLSARRHAEERARMLVEAAPNAIVLVNSSGHIELINSQSEQLFGYTRSELIGQTVEILIPESLREKHPGLRDGYHQAPSQRQMGGNRELFARHKSGRAIPVEVGLAPIMAGGQRLIQAIVIDISARKAAEQKLREQAEQLALANRYKSEFLANMSHELRTPLNSILILSEQLKHNVGGNLSSKQISHADIIHRSGSDLLNLINDILDLSKVEAGRMTLVLEAVSVRELVAALETSFRPLADAKGLMLNCQVAEDVPTHVRTDNQRLHQILRNLLSNAIKFTEHGRVEVTVTVMRNDLPLKLLTTEALCLTVRDTGIGIAPSQHETVFQAFRQADGSTSRRFGGTGLGLTISRQLAELLGGVLTLDSKLGLGSAFSLLLPMSVVTDRVSSSTLQISGPAHNTARLLIIEDDPAFAQVVIDTANQYGFTSYSTSSGIEALELLDRVRFDGLILDLLLPDISGWQVLKEVRTRANTRDLPIHIISCVQQPLNWDDKQLCYLVKPVSHDELHRLLKQLQRDGKATALPVLLVEDNDVEREHYQQQLQRAGVPVVACATAAEAIVAYRHGNFLCLIIDLHLPDQSGFDLLRDLNAERALIGTGVIINTGMDLSNQDQQTLRQFSAALVQKGPDSGTALVRAIQPFLGTVLPGLVSENLSPAYAQHRGRRVLVVDDDVRNIYAMSALLEQFEMEVAVARDGQEAVQLLSRDSRFDLVLMDMAMPVMDGYTATRILKRERQLPTPVVALTAHAMKGDREKCLQAGADDYLAKPVDASGIRELLARWLKPHEGD
jgi:PAS domain S-box-containing protein